jgi:hypothetical protein
MSGEDIERTIVDDLHAAKFVIVIASKAGLESTWVQFEMGAAWGNRESILVPMLMA